MGRLQFGERNDKKIVKYYTVVNPINSSNKTDRATMILALRMVCFEIIEVLFPYV